MKKFFAILGALIALYCFQLYQLGKNYDSLVLPMDANTVVEKMGKPDDIGLGNNEDVYLTYWETPLPSYYGLRIENGLVVEKWESISP